MMHEYYYLGRSMGMTRIAGHNSFLCVDTRSQESFMYIQGVPVEPDEMSVMQRFVGPGDTFVDIGANFGLYSMIAGERIGEQGKLFAFEANPHTYEYLRHSAIANRLIWRANFKFENLAVTDHAGQIELAFNPQELGGGHIKGAVEYADKYQFAVVPCVRLDDYFNPEQTIDFVKIDVEGHEVSVLQGMQDLIRRSPNIRLLIEYLTSSTEVNEYGRSLTQFLRSLGFGLCQVGENGSLHVIPDEVIPTGNLYLLATRTPEEDATVPAGSMRIAPRGLRLLPIYTHGEHALLSESGILEFDAARNGSIAEPTLFYGPYADLKAGNYRLVIDADGLGSAHVSITADAGHKHISSFVASSWPCQTNFILKEDVSHFEIVLNKTDDLERLSMRQLILTRS